MTKTEYFWAGALFVVTCYAIYKTIRYNKIEKENASLKQDVSDEKIESTMRNLPGDKLDEILSANDPDKSKV